MAGKVRGALGLEHLDDAVSFNSFDNILQPPSWTERFLEVRFASLEAVHHPVTTTRSERDHINRGLLMTSYHAIQEQLLQTIWSNPSHSMTMLYRGFPRLMLDNLAVHPDCKNKLKSQRTVLSKKVAL
ncbi:uncharacterized protein HMPREF1541_08628 [Cyphellophora europaea CBS 101466]|uniref:Uncharacterized protein n=1 Tax=Cyphellophora europaea (strain CBS 101466) TaxID=1220924 RepID=W2RIQ4_CYPE1|nr:uncharacterized protein HMPREF1541_08628 [Cyphellophora europaea CBS 101466]ETN36351.1 hypothetical protein HMPREF1541_08628 [Cyphellophora europaea CBS 101466]